MGIKAIKYLIDNYFSLGRYEFKLMVSETVYDNEDKEPETKALIIADGGKVYEGKAPVWGCNGVEVATARALNKLRNDGVKCDKDTKAILSSVVWNLGL